MTLRQAQGERYFCTTPLWRWSGPSAASWYFVTIAGETGEALSVTALMHRLEGGKRAGWGSVKVEVAVGESRWQTSAFPSKESGWIVPVKASVRKAEGLAEGAPVALELRF